MDPATRWQINSPTVVHEVIDGEAIMIHLGTGAYYSSDRVGTEIWKLVARNCSLAEILDAQESRHDGRADLQQVRASVRAFLDSLLADELIRESETLSRRPEDDHPSSSPSRPQDPEPFNPPRLEKYSALEDLLLADPIHDVETAGWPHQLAR